MRGNSDLRSQQNHGRRVWPRLMRRRKWLSMAHFSTKWDSGVRNGWRSRRAGRGLSRSCVPWPGWLEDRLLLSGVAAEAVPLALDFPVGGMLAPLGATYYQIA